MLANGVFDIFHIGHIRYLEAAAAMGDRLIVSVTRDEFVKKGRGRPFYKEADRVAMLKALRIVSDVFLTDSSRHALEAIKPDVFVKGSEYREKIMEDDIEFCQQNGIEIRFTDTETVRPRDRARLG